MRKAWIYFILALSMSFWVQAQTNAWGTLMLTQFEKEYKEDWGMEVDKPIFSPALEAMEGTKIDLHGYIIPIEGRKSQAHFMFSAFPVNMCYFCGKAGPESVIEVFMKDGEKVTFTDEKIWLSGQLKLNAFDPTSSIYVLEQAELH